MNKNTLFSFWGGMFIVCAAAGFIPVPQGIARVILTALAILFFLPPALLIHRAVQQKDLLCLKLIRNLAAASLSLTLVLFVMSILSVKASEWVGDFLHAVMIIVSAPMICSGYWAVSMFLWACLLVACIQNSRII